MRPLNFKDTDKVHGIQILKIIADSDRRKTTFLCPFCNVIKDTWRGALLAGKIKSCGCQQHHKREWKSKQFEDLSGQQFGRLTVLVRDMNARKRTYFLCRCSCGKKVSVWAAQLKNGKTTTCGDVKHFCGSDSPSWKGEGQLSGHQFSHIKLHARNRKIPFLVTKQYLWELFQRQRGCCQISGVPISLVKDSGGQVTASLDRIDNRRAYEQGNVQWVHKDVNYMKRTLSMEQLLEYCRLIVKKNQL